MIAPARAVEAEEAERAGLTDQLAERDPDHDGRQHERHQQQRPAATPRPGKRTPVQEVRRGQAEQHRDRRARAAPTRP